MLKNDISQLLLVIISLSIIISFSGCTFEVDSETPEIITSISIVADITSNIVNGSFDIFSIVEGLEDPHTYEPLPSEITKISEAKLFIYFGIPGLEPWVPSILESNPNINTLKLVDWNAGEYLENDPLLGVNTSNSHVWMSPNIVKSFVDKITDSISELDSENQIVYESNGVSYKNELDILLNEIDTKKIEKFNGIKVVVHHPSFMYLLDLLGINRTAVIEERHDSEPSADHIADIIDLMNTDNIKIVISQPQVEEEVINSILTETGAVVVNLTPLLGVTYVIENISGEEEKVIDSYIEMIRYNIDTLEAAIDALS